MKPLTTADFIRILTEPKNALIKQYVALMETEGVKLHFTDDAIAEIAAVASRVNEDTDAQATVARVLREKVLEETSFDAPDLKKKTVKIDALYVRKQLSEIVKDQDLSRYIL